ncbi:MAG: hypothetical protein FWG85_04075 [Bacteroidetes bacterium]|nr:hypothetical protein [Bacteroidota bacterium]
MPRVFIEGNHNSQSDSKEYKDAELLGKKLVALGYTVVSSARKGISEAVFKGAEKENSNSIRVAIDCAEINLPRNNKFSKEIIADNYFDMKMKNCINSDAFIFLPGSFSVLCNLAIVLQLKKLELMGNKPLICVGEQLENILELFSFYNEDVLDIFDKLFFVDDVDGAVNVLIKNLKK